MKMSVCAIGCVAAALVLVMPGIVRADETEVSVNFFESKIRPVLVKQCYECHSAKSKELKGNLFVDSREGLRRGGDSGPAVVPKNLDDSILLEALRYEGLEMPPDKPLPEQTIRDFERWILGGAVDPRVADPNSASLRGIRHQIDLEEGRQYWAFQPITEPANPTVRNSQWVNQPLDAFVLHRLESSGLKPNPVAAPAERLRRLYFDLVGLPPDPAAVERFERDPSPSAWAAHVDQLLESPRFGERWARHWLDVVRFGESTGMERNFTYPYAWRYRQYVISAFNADKPFDQFLTEQLAGDLLETDSDSHRLELLTATGVLAMGPKSLNETNREQFQMDVVDEQLDLTTRAFLGLTVACARCHDHKFDPIPTTDYYALAGIFTSTETFFGTGSGGGNRNAGKLLAISGDQVRKVGAGSGNQDRKRLQQKVNAAKRKLAQYEKRTRGNRNEKAIAKLKAQLRKQQAALREADAASPAEGTSQALVMAVLDSQQIGDTQVRLRGEPGDRGETVPRRVLSVLKHLGAPEFNDDTSGRRELAAWMASPQNPLTARVAVNRVWQHLFGRGIVASVNNFGRTGDRPSHPELLDHLASRFMAQGWSVKSVIREIVISQTYQQSSAEQPQGLAADPENELLWRMNVRRLEAEAIRDAILQAAGRLDVVPPTSSVVQQVGDGNVGRTISVNQFGSDSDKRSVYLPIVRGAVPEFLSVFDFPEPSMVAGQRDVTTVAPQALLMLNNQWVLRAAGDFANRLLAEEPKDVEARIQRAYRIAFAREAVPQEVGAAREFLDSFDGGTERAVGHQAWTQFCQALIASAEFRFVN